MTDDTFTDAFGEGYRLGFRVGWDGGDLHGRGEERTAWNYIIGVYRKTVEAPTQEQLAEARTTPRNCTCDRCSTCTRRAAVETNQRLYGQDDYPGAEKAAQIRAQRAGGAA